MGNFTSRGFATANGDLLNNPQYDKQLNREALAQTEWETGTVEVRASESGTIQINSGDPGVVKRVNISETSGSTQFRAAYMLEIDQPGIYGQQVGPVASKHNFLYQDVEVVEQRTARTADETNRQKRLGYNTLALAGGAPKLARDAIARFAGRMANHDHFAALANGYNDAGLAPATVQGLELNIGGVTNSSTNATTGATIAGSRALHENFVGFDCVTASSTVTSAMDVGQLLLNSATDIGGVKGRQSHENAMAQCVAGMQDVMRQGSAAEQAKMFLTKDSIKGIRYWANKFNIKPLMGAGYDYELRVDWEVAEALIGTLSGTELDTIVAIMKLSASGNGDTNPLMDIRQKRLILDGVLITPSKHLQAWRPANFSTEDGGRIVYASDANAGSVVDGTGAVTTQPSQTGYWKEGHKFRPELNQGKVGLAYLLGDAALIHATDGALTVTEAEGDHNTGKEWQGQSWRSIARSVWTGKDAATSTMLRNESSIQLFFGVPQNLGAL